ncbi:hypothetical protein DY000_02017150 [Brassica cretica]|uniref:Uncharacterized protein n=1 Tax=Brassica cretica TaxID=69181 RepID=A0ABQ7D6H1_BRACR|nr:hypothetical protein DY000_02017150 [Brassica cretica]
MVSQIVWLGVRDVFTQIAKDVVGQGLDHGTLTFKVIRSNIGKETILGSRIKVFDTMPRDVRDQCAGFRARPRFTPGFRGCDIRLTFKSSRRICFEKMLVRMNVWSSKKVFLSRKEILSKNKSSGVYDVSRG